ncbi:hypothetical protein IHQ71_25330 [Rhizobium sp. TH2]|uniref:DUF6000 family protein n=1 Tax=Rhizobium sp. TH2 TaxID=2775403 RepID=UPI002157DE21|nr:DUF6000 family protein [Rhizobium sp. TH2]UVC08431.1 hypothetical protein IHQ71_25330 [Rhizobium sp. TH2]
MVQELVGIAAEEERYVWPFHMRVMHGNFLFLDAASERDTFMSSLLKVAREISDAQIERLLNSGDWRDRLCAPWFIGLTFREQFVPRIDRLLSQGGHGQGYCVALALIGTDECAAALRRYLDTHLPINDQEFDQDWALGALALLEGEIPAEYLKPDLWKIWRSEKDPMPGIKRFAKIIAYLRTYISPQVSSPDA